MIISIAVRKAYHGVSASAGCPRAKEHTMAKGQKRSNKEIKKPKADKKAAAATLSPTSVGGVMDRTRK
jgi:hypothetical protein